MKAEKTIGWLLLMIGILIIILSLYYSWLIFTGKKEVPSLFHSRSDFHILENKGGKTMEGILEGMIKSVLSKQLNSIISARKVDKILNLSFQSLLIFSFIFGGGKIGELGVKLLKNNGPSSSN